MEISPDHIIYWQWGGISLNATIVFTWLVMGLLIVLSRWVSARLIRDVHLPRGQNLWESIVAGMLRQIRDICPGKPERLLPFLGTLFLFIAVCNVLAVVPGFVPPTGSLSTTAALALCVFVAVPLYGITRRGVKQYLRNYVQPTPLMLPFNVMGELSRTLALAVRLFGNIMSGHMIGAILLSIAPVFVPVIMQLFGLLTGLVQAYIFSILAAVYIVAGLQVNQTTRS